MNQETANYIMQLTVPDPTIWKTMNEESKRHYGICN